MVWGIGGSGKASCRVLMAVPSRHFTLIRAVLLLVVVVVLGIVGCCFSANISPHIAVAPHNSLRPKQKAFLQFHICIYIYTHIHIHIYIYMYVYV